METASAELIAEESAPSATAADSALFPALRLLRGHWQRLVAVPLAVGLATLLVSFAVPNYYRVRAVISPTGDENKQMGALGTLAAVGLQLGGASKIEDLETLFRSSDLAARVFATHDDLWAIALPGDYDAATKRLKQGLLARLISREPPSAPGPWQAIRATDDALTIVANRRAGTLTLTFQAASAAGATAILTAFLDEAKSRLQDEALARAGTNRRFLEGQIAKTDDALSRDRLFSMLGQELEREMMARNREQFGFKVLDAPRTPDRKSGPKRAISAVFATAASFALFAMYLARRKR